MLSSGVISLNLAEDAKQQIADTIGVVAIEPNINCNGTESCPERALYR
jgi:hypothetical protein